MSLGKSLRYIFEQRLKVRRDRWAEDEWVKDQAHRDCIILWLSELGEIPDDLSERITFEENRDLLISWSKVAARATSIQDFRDRCQI